MVKTLGGECACYVVPHGEEGTRYAGHSEEGKVLGGERASETAVLHPYLDAECYASFEVEAAEAGEGVT